MAEPADLGTTYSRAYNAAERTGPSCCAHVAGLEAVADAAKRRVLDELIVAAQGIRAEQEPHGYPFDWLGMWETLTDRIERMREKLDHGV